MKATLASGSGQLVTVTKDGDIYKLETNASFSGSISIGEVKIKDVAGNLINPSTKEGISALEALITAIKNTDGIKKIEDELPAGTNLMGKIQLRNPGDSVDLGDATNPIRVDPTGDTAQPISATSLPLPSGASTSALQTTGNTSLGTIDTALTSIKDTAGIKKITDALPTGTNWLGKLQVGDGTNSVGVLNNALQVMQYEIRTLFPDFVKDYLKNGSGASQMKVNGSVTPVVFHFDAHPTKDTYIDRIILSITGSSVALTGAKFAGSAGLTNGLLFETVCNNGTSKTLATIKINEEFFELTPMAFMTYNTVGTGDGLFIHMNFDGHLFLKANTADTLKITVRDDLATIASLAYLKCAVYALLKA